MLKRLKNLWKLGEYRVDVKTEYIKNLPVGQKAVLVSDQKPKGMAKIIGDNPLSAFSHFDE